MAKTLADEVLAVLIKYQNLCTVVEVAWAINKERAECGERQSNYLVPELRQLFIRIRKDPKKYGLLLFYKSTSRYEPYVAVPLNADLFFSLTPTQQNSIKEGSKGLLKKSRQIAKTSLDQMEKYKSLIQDPNRQKMYEDLITFQRTHVLLLDSLLGRLSAAEK